MAKILNSVKNLWEVWKKIRRIGSKIVEVLNVLADISQKRTKKTENK